MATVGLQPASNAFSRSNAEKTLRKPVRLEYLAKYLAAGDLDELTKRFPGGLVHVWGVKSERVYQWAKLIPEHCLVLFRQGPRAVFRGIVVYRLISEPLALHLWGRDEDDQTWSLVYFLSHLKPIDIPAREINAAAKLDLDWNWQGFITLLPPESTAVLELVAQHEGL